MHVIICLFVNVLAAVFAYPRALPTTEWISVYERADARGSLIVRPDFPYTSIRDERQISQSHVAFSVFLQIRSDRIAVAVLLATVMQREEAEPQSLVVSPGRGGMFHIPTGSVYSLNRLDTFEDFNLVDQILFDFKAESQGVQAGEHSIRVRRWSFCGAVSRNVVRAFTAAIASVGVM